MRTTRVAIAMLRYHTPVIRLDSQSSSMPADLDAERADGRDSVRYQSAAWRRFSAQHHELSDAPV